MADLQPKTNNIEDTAPDENIPGQLSPSGHSSDAPDSQAGWNGQHSAALSKTELAGGHDALMPGNEEISHPTVHEHDRELIPGVQDASTGMTTPGDVVQIPNPEVPKTHTQ